MSDDHAFDSTRPRARGDAVIRDVDGGVVAWSPISPEPIHLGPLSAAVLQLLDGEVSAGELVTDLSAVLDVDDAMAREILGRELSHLDGAGLLATSSPSTYPGRNIEVFPAPPDP